MRATISRSAATAAVAAFALMLAGCEPRASSGVWLQPNGDLAGTRAASGSLIGASNVHRLRVRWRFTLRGRPGYSGIFSSTPVADRDTVYIEDLRSTVFALNRSTGTVRWRRRFSAPNDGPNGLTLAGAHVVGTTDTGAFALSASTGESVWQRELVRRGEQFVDVAPVVWKDLVFVSTVGYPPFGRGAIYALDADTGTVRWRFVTVKRPWLHPRRSGGGGLWYPVSVDERGRLYAGNSNPSPWGGSAKWPNGAVFPGAVPYTDSLLVLDALSGRLLWYDQVTAHDVRDQDFEATPILATVGGVDMVFGAGKAGRVIAWNRRSRERLWTKSVGVHRNDLGPLPSRRVIVCPNLLGGVETPMAYASGRLFVPVVDLCGWGSAVEQEPVSSLDPMRGRGRLVALDAATGRQLWDRRLPLPDFGCATVSNDVVFTSTYDGTVYALSAADGTILWRARMRAGVNACPSVAGDLLILGAGVRSRRGRLPELVAFGLP